MDSASTPKIQHIEHRRIEMVEHRAAFGLYTCCAPNCHNAMRQQERRRVLKREAGETRKVAKPLEYSGLSRKTYSSRTCDGLLWHRHAHTQSKHAHTDDALRPYKITQFIGGLWLYCEGGGTAVAKRRVVRLRRIWVRRQQ